MQQFGPCIFIYPCKNQRVLWCIIILQEFRTLRGQVSSVKCLYLLNDPLPNYHLYFSAVIITQKMKGEGKYNSQTTRINCQRKRGVYDTEVKGCLDRHIGTQSYQYRSFTSTEWRQHGE